MAELEREADGGWGDKVNGRGRKGGGGGKFIPTQLNSFAPTKIFHSFTHSFTHYLLTNYLTHFHSQGGADEETGGAAVVGDTKKI